MVSRVVLSSPENCDQFKARINSFGDWEPVGAPIDSQKTFVLSVQSMKSIFLKTGSANPALYFRCPSGFRVHRDPRLASYTYDGDFVSILNGSSMIQIINLVDSEVYLKGVVPTEVHPSWPTEALKAQAVAARTYAWWNVLDSRRSEQKSFDMDDTIQYQAYSGITQRTLETDQAVEETRGLVLKYQGKVIKAYFSADSGGYTESGNLVFEKELPYCVAKPELYDVSKTQTNWEKTYSKSELQYLLNFKFASIQVTPEDLHESGRAGQVTLLFSNGKLLKMDGISFRRKLKLRSTRFRIETEWVNGTEKIRIRGTGYGHGVGMAQIGAREYATQLGWTFDQIVKFYYHDTVLETVPNDYTE